MANELPEKPLVPPVTGGTPPAAPAPAPAAPVAPVVVAPPVSAPKDFGGHKGGGKKRLDKLVAGSPEAEAVDKENNAMRVWLDREEAARKVGNGAPKFNAEFAERLKKILPVHRDKYLKRVVAMAEGTPPPLARPAAAAPLAPAAVAAPDAAQLLSPSAAVAAPGVVAVFVEWSKAKLERACKLLIKIGERVETYFAAKKVATLNLEPHREKKVLEQFKIDDAAATDLSNALSTAAAIELNKRRIGGAEHSHWIDVGLCVVEVVQLKMKNWDMLDKMILEDRAEKAKKLAEKDAEKS